MEQKHLISTLESILFVSNKPLKTKALAKILEQPENEVQEALNILEAEKKETGVVVINNNGEYQLATNALNSTAVKNFLNAELREKLTDATVEVLAIISYRQPISKAEIEAIRGVNSQYSLRHLLMRGLIEKVSNPQDQRSFLYQTTTEFLQHLGISTTKDLPEFEKLVSQIKLPETPAILEKTESQPQTQEEQPQSNSQELLDPQIKQDENSASQDQEVKEEADEFADDDEDEDEDEDE
jgi:segregation and condensation protein B